uniref:Dehydrogenase/reductase (SDR family) member 13b.1 n=1 Tax=Cyprinodon variegatus TaxID=28743 RepID=A0A3Q2DP90_CYPVA
MLFILLVLGLIFLAYIFRPVLVIGKSCKSNAKLHGKTVIVTGSNTGIGKATAIEIAKRGARVILACRSKQRGEAALQDVKRSLNIQYLISTQLHHDADGSVLLHCSRSISRTILKFPLNIFFGVVLLGRTEDGFGTMFGVNHLGHFLLTNLLLDRLKDCAPSRVVTVSSTAHNWGRVDFNYLNTHKDLREGTSFWDSVMIYGDSKLCNVLFTHELAKRLQGTKVTCYSLHPGGIYTELARNKSSFVQMVLKYMGMYFFKNAVQGSQTTLHCALQEGIEHLSGRYFSNCTVREVFKKAKDDAASKKLWDISERFCGI